MNKTKKTVMMVAGGMAMLGVIAYYMMPRESKKSIMSMMDKMTSSHCCDNPDCPFNE